MRIDLVLKYLCMAKSRAMAKAMCDRGAVEVGGQPVKASAAVREGDQVTLHFPRRTITFEIVNVPTRQLSKSQALEYYREAD